LSVIVATMIGAAGAGAGTGAGARLLVTVALLASLRSAGAAFSLGTGLIPARGAAMAAMGVIRMAKDNKQATNTRVVAGIDSGFDLFTVFS